MSIYEKFIELLLKKFTGKTILTESLKYYARLGIKIFTISLKSAESFKLTTSRMLDELK